MPIPIATTQITPSTSVVNALVSIRPSSSASARPMPRIGPYSIAISIAPITTASELAKSP